MECAQLFHQSSVKASKSDVVVHYALTLLFDLSSLKFSITSKINLKFEVFISIYS
jgi:hypothetical protein